MATLSEKLRSSGNTLIDRLRGIETPQMTTIPSPTENPQNEAIFEEIRGLREKGIPLSKIKKAIGVMELPNAEEVKNYARELFFNTQLTPSDNKLVKPKTRTKDEELQTEIQELLAQGKDKNIVERAIDLADEIKDKEKAKDILKSLVSKFSKQLSGIKIDPESGGLKIPLGKSEVTFDPNFVGGVEKVGKEIIKKGIIKVLDEDIIKAVKEKGEFFIRKVMKRDVDEIGLMGTKIIADSPIVYDRGSLKHYETTKNLKDKTRRLRPFETSEVVKNWEDILPNPTGESNTFLFVKKLDEDSLAIVQVIEEGKKLRVSNSGFEIPDKGYLEVRRKIKKALLEGRP